MRVRELTEILSGMPGDIKITFCPKDYDLYADAYNIDRAVRVTDLFGGDEEVICLIGD